MATDNPVREGMLIAGFNIFYIANELTKAKASDSGAIQNAEDVIVEAVKQYARKVINGAAYIDSYRTEEEAAQAESETSNEMEKARQKSLEQLKPFFRWIGQQMGEDKARSDAVQTEKMEQLVATLEEEVIRLKKENEELKSSHAAELQRVRAEAERAIKEAEERSVAASAESVLTRPRRTKTTGRSRDDESGLVTALEEELTQNFQEIEDLKAELQRARAETKAQSDRRVDHREETAAALGTTTDHLTVETAVAIEDEETSAATIEAAAETETDTALDLDLDNADVNSTIDTNAIVRLIEVAENSEDKLIAGKLPVLRMVQDIFEASFKPENHKDLHQNLRCLSSQLLSILCPLPTLNNQFAESMKAEAEQMKIESGVMLNAGYCSILSQYETIKSAVEANEANSKGVRDMAFAIKEALFRAKCDNDEERIRDAIKKADQDVESFINGAVSKTFVKNNLSIGNPTRFLMVHVLDSFLAVDYLSRVSIRMAYQYLENASDLIKRAKEFAQKANAEVPFDEDFSVLQYLFTYVSAAMKNENDDLNAEAWVVAHSVIFSSNDVNQFASLLREVECGTYSGGKDENATVYLSGVGQAYDDKRLKVFRTISVFFLRPLIERHVPPGFFAKFGYTRSFLRISASTFRKLTPFIKPEFYSEPGKHRENFDSIIAKKAQKGEDKGERTIFIQSAEQRESLKRLVVTHSALVK